MIDLACVEPTLGMRILRHHGSRGQFPVLPAAMALKVPSDANLLDLRKSSPDILNGISCVVREEKIELDLILVDNRSTIVRT